MIVRPLTFLTGMMFAFSGAYLFVVKHQSQNLEDTLGQLAQISRSDEQAIRVLKAQWALEADPSRIAALSAEFTQLKPMQPSQLVTLASLSSSLPAPGSAAPYSNPDDLVPEIPDGTGSVPVPSGPAIQVRGHDVADVAAPDGSMSGTASASRQVVADNQAVMALPPPPPPMLPHVAPDFHSSVHLAAAEIGSRSWIAPIPRQERRVHRALPVPPPVVVATPAVIQTRAEAVSPAPDQPFGARVVRIKAVEHQAGSFSQHDVISRAPLDGGSLLGMAQSGSQN